MTSTSTRFGRYRLEYVRAIIESYAELYELRGTGTSGGVRLICTFADLKGALRAMPPKEYRTMLVHGLLRYTVRDTGAILGIGKSTVDDLYLTGLAWLTAYLNGEIHE